MPVYATTRIEIDMADSGMFDSVLFDSVIFDTVITNGGFLNVGADAVDGIALKYGIEGNGPLDCVAGTGTCQYMLRNDAVGGALGRYSPGNAACIAGWGFGVTQRVIFSYEGVDYTRFYGKVRAINPDTGIHARRQVAVTTYDIMRDLAETDVREISVQIGKTESEIVTNVLAALPAGSQPLATDIDVGVDTFPYALDNLGGATKALSVISDVARSSFALVACKGNGTLIMRSRHTRTTGVSSFTFTAGDFIDVQVPSDLAGVFNLVRVTIHPKTVDIAATTVLFALTGTVPSIAPGMTLDMWGNYNDAANAQRLIGGIPRSGPLLVSGTDFAGNAAIDGTGANLTADLADMGSYAYGTSVHFIIKNSGTSTVYLIAPSGSGPKLQVRGKGVYDRGPQTYQASSTQPYGIRPLDVDQPYQNDPNIGQASAEYIEAIYNNLLRQPSDLTFIANVSAAKMIFALTVEPGIILTLSEPMTGLVAVGVVVQSVSLGVVEGVITCKLGLAPSSVFSFWLWGIVGRSEWGESTIYGF